MVCIGAFVAAGITNQYLEKETAKTVGTVSQCDFPMFKDAGFHNNIEFVTAKGEKHQFYQSTIELMSLNDKVPVRYNPENPRDEAQIDKWIEIYIASETLLLIGLTQVAAILSNIFQRNEAFKFETAIEGFPHTGTVILALFTGGLL